MPRVVSHPSLGWISVGPVEPARTYALRQQVLRPHQQVADMGWLDSDDPRAMVIAATTGREDVVATGAVRPEAPPAVLETLLGPLDGRAGQASWRLRAMATRPDVTGTGLGAAVLAELVDHVTTGGGGLLWCTARVPAVAFYERAGLRTAGGVWEAEGIGPHVHMWRLVGGGSGAPDDPSDVLDDGNRPD